MLAIGRHIELTVTLTLVHIKGINSPWRKCIIFFWADNLECSRTDVTLLFDA